MDNPFADLIPKKPATNPFADLIPKKPAPFKLGSDEGRGRADDAARFAQISKGAQVAPLSPDSRTFDPLAVAARNTNLPIGPRVLAAAGQEAGDVARAGPDWVQHQLQRLREGGEFTPADAGETLGAALQGGVKEAPGGAAGVPKPLAAKPRVEPPPLATPGAPNPFESLVPRNAEGRPVAPPGGFKPEANPFTDLVPKADPLSRTASSGGPDLPRDGEVTIFGKTFYFKDGVASTQEPDPRAAAAGETAVRKVADRVASPAAKTPEPTPPPPMTPRPAGSLTPWGALDGSEQSALKSEWVKGVESGSIGTQFAEWLVAKKGIGPSKATASSDPLLAAVQAPFTKSGINTQAFTGKGASAPTIPSKAPKTAPPPPPKPAANRNDITHWVKKSGKKGYNEGGVYADENGVDHYVKFAPKPDVAVNEFLANRLYKAVGVPVLDIKRRVMGGKPVLASRMEDLTQFDVNNPTHVAAARKNFAAHAWLGNRDVVGNTFDNQAITKSGDMLTVDSGGALKYKGIGEPKTDFGPKVTEWEGLQNPPGPSLAGKVFHDMTPDEMRESAKPVLALSDANIHKMVANAGYPPEFAETLIARRNDIAAKVKALPGGIAKPAPAPAPTKPKAAKPKAPKPTPQTWHDFVADPKALPLPRGKTTEPDSPFDKWYKEIYQTGKHGEGLPMSDLARKSRAKKQGFNTDLTLYHGTGKSDFLRFDMAKHQSEPAIFVSDDPRVSKAYSSKGSTPAVIPLWAKMENPKTIDWKGQDYGSTIGEFKKAIDQAKAEGHDVVIIKNIQDLGSNAPQTQYAFFKPGNIRSQKSAAFDPKVKEPDAHLLSAAGTPTADLLRLNKANYDDKLPKAPGAVQMVKNAGQTLKSILAPQTMNASAERAAASIRKNIGRSVQDSERAKLAMEPYRKMLQNDTLEEQLTVLKWLQQPDTKIAKGLEPSDELKPFLQAFKDLMLDRRAKLEARSKTGDMGFKDDYVSQMWKDPDAARDVLHSLGPKEGSNSFTKRSVIEDYEAGIKAGLIPLTTDPVEIAMRYVENVDRFIAINDVLEEGAANKDIVWRAPEHAPNGWVKLDGRARSFKGGAFQDAYAPPGYADVYNAFVSKPPQGAWGDVLGAAQKVSNSVSAFKLAVSGYHALNIAGEANVAGLANAIDKLAGGDVLGAAKGAVGSPAKFVTSVARGRQMLNTYMTGMGSPEMQKVVQLAVDANFRVAGKGRIADEYRFSSLGSLWDSWKKGLLKGELKEMGKDIKARPLVGSAKAIVSTAARALETMSDPLFKHYIPMVKNGAYFDMVKTWLDAHPGASVAEQTAFARKAADIIDNRFGEMNQDNIFWQRWQKQLAQTLVVSYSYELGTARLIGGAAKDAAGLAKGKGWSPNLSYAIALPVMIGAMGAAYQYIKTGKPPESPRDMMYPQTGGQDPMSGQPARAVLPSYMSQFVNAYFGGLTHEIANKKNGIFDLLSAAFTGQDWRGDPITAVDDSTTDAIKKWLGYAAGTWEPVLASQTKKGGTGISGGERFAGIREAPMFANDPAAYKRMTESKRLQADAEAAWHKRNADLEAKGQHPNFYVKRQFIRDYMVRHKPGYGGTQ